MEKVALKGIKKGTYIKRKENSSEVYQLLGFDRSSKKYCLQAESDISECIYLKGSTQVYIGFYY